MASLRMAWIGALVLCGSAAAAAVGGPWHKARVPAPEPFFSAIVVDPKNPHVVYAGTIDSGLYKSADNGRTWHTLLPDVPVAGLAVDPRNPDVLYLAGSGKSTDGGAHWRFAPAPGGNAVAVDPRDSQILYATGQNDVSKSTDGGVTWRKVRAGLPRLFDGSALAVDPTTGGTVYAGTNHGVFKTTNGGASWRAALPNADVAQIVLDPTRPATVYAGTKKGVYKSVDGGAHWATSNRGLTRTFLNALAIDRSHPQTLYAGADSGGVFETTNGGRTWHDVNQGLADDQIDSLAVSPSGPTVFAGSEDGLFVRVGA